MTFFHHGKVNVIFVIKIIDIRDFWVIQLWILSCIIYKYTEFSKHKQIKDMDYWNSVATSELLVP